VLRKRAAQQVVGTPLVDFPDVTASTEPSSGALSLRQAGGLPAAEPTVLTGALIGYSRDSAKDQIPDRQTAALEAAGCIRIFADKQSGGNADRKELPKALDYLRPGNTPVVPTLGRLDRSLQDLIWIVAGLRKRGVRLWSLKEALDTTTPAGGWCSTCSPPWPGSSARSSSRARSRAWPPPAPAASPCAARPP
jgi:hypothetical protein